MKNTKKQGKFTIFTYQEKPNLYIGVCLEFDLVVEEKTPQEALRHILNASYGYLRTIIKNNFSDDLLNEKPLLKYLKKYEELLKEEAKRVAKIKKETKKAVEIKKERKKLIAWNDFFEQVPYNRQILEKLKEANV